MKKNKESDKTESYNKAKIPSLKPYFIWGGLLIIFMGAAFVVFKQYTNKSKVTFIPPRTTVAQNTSPQVEKKPPAPIDQKETETSSSHQSLEELESKILSRMASLEQQLKAAQSLIGQGSHKKINLMIARDLCQAVLMDQIPLTTLMQFLNRLNDPWATKVLKSLEGIGQIKTFEELEKLIAQKPKEKRSLWSRVKEKLGSMVQVRKIDKSGAYQDINLEDIQRSLRTHDPQEVLRLYSNLPDDEKEALKDLKTAIFARIQLKKISIEILNWIAEGKAE